MTMTQHYEPSPRIGHCREKHMKHACKGLLESLGLILGCPYKLTGAKISISVVLFDMSIHCTLSEPETSLLKWFHRFVKIFMGFDIQRLS